MMSKRIAMLSYHTCPLASEEGKETGGMNVYVLQVAKELAALGYTIDIFTRSQDEKQPHVVPIADNLRLIHTKAGPENYVPKKQLIEFIPEFVENIKNFQKKENIQYDVLDCHYYLSGIAGLALQDSHKKPPMLINFHTLALMKNLVAREAMEKEEKVRIDAEYELTKKAQKIITPSESDKEYLEYLYETPPNILKRITPGVDTKLFRPIDKKQAREHIRMEHNNKMILFVGRIEPLKGLDVILYALKILVEQCPDIRVCFWIVGGDVSQRPELWSNELQKLEALRHLLKLSTAVKFVGQQPQHELPYYYNAADLVVMPSHYESFGMAALEAMACGTPVITSNVSGISNLINDTCDRLITSANNPLLLAEQMKEVLTNNTESEKFATKLANNVKVLDWSNVAKQIAGVYDELTG